MPELFSYWAEPDLGRRFCAAAQRGDRRRWSALEPRPLRRPRHRARSRTWTLAIAMLRRGPRPRARRRRRSARTSTGRASDRRSSCPSSRPRPTLGLCVFVHAFHPPHWELRRRSADVGGGQLPARDRHARSPPMIANGVVEQSPGLRARRQPRRRHAAAAPPPHGRRSGTPIRRGSPGARRRTTRSASLWFDTLTYAPAELRALIDLVGTDHVDDRIGRAVLRRARPATCSTACTTSNRCRRPTSTRSAGRVRSASSGSRHARSPRTPRSTRMSAADHRHGRPAADDLGRRPRRRTARRLDQPPPGQVARPLPTPGRGGRQDRLAVRGQAQVARRARRSPVRSGGRQARPRSTSRSRYEDLRPGCYAAGRTRPGSRRRRHRGLAVLPVVPAVLRPGVHRGRRPRARPRLRASPTTTG